VRGKISGMLECGKCGYQGTRDEFRYMGQAKEVGATTFRKCPKCEAVFICNEIEVDDDYRGATPWGLSSFRGKVFKGKKKEVL